MLYVTTAGSTMSFFANLIRRLLNEGHTIDIACNENLKPIPPFYREWGCIVYSIDCDRNPFSLKTFRTIRQIQALVATNSYDIVHCHTPVASICTRLACRKFRRNGLRVFYTAHGFHFYKGAPVQNWMLYYPAEKICAHMTDMLITINKEDYRLAHEKMHARRVEYVPGVGIDINKFHNAVVNKSTKRAAFGIPADAFLLISVGELNTNKNHQVIIHAVAKLQDPSVHYLVVGAGPKKTELELMAHTLGVSEQIHLVGFRSDVAELYKMADVNVFPSIREGLGMASIEGMAAGIPLICANNRGTREYAQVYQEAGFHAMCLTVNEYVAAIRTLQNNRELYEKLCRIGYLEAQKYSVYEINRRMMMLYEE